MAMELNYVNIMLYVTGIFTASVGFIFFFPELLLEKMFKIKLGDQAAIFIARHWALLVGIVGLLIICSVHNPAIQPTILIAAIIEKAVIVLMILANFKKEFTKGFRLAAFIDAVCVVLYILVLTGIT
jgi:hypothetical protein